MAEALRSVSRAPAPRAVAPQAADARIATLDDLPPAGTRHWVPRYKAAVVAAVDAGVLSMDDARRRYMLSEEELHSWRETIGRYGVVGLRMSVSERRTAPRLAVSERGWASLSGGQEVGCLIADISDHGARLELEETVTLPNLFELHCEKSMRSWWVELAWQRGETAGVRFTNPLPPPFAIRAGLGAWLIGRRGTVAIDRKA